MRKERIGLAAPTHIRVKITGANGQISLGKRYAGRQVLIEEQEPGVWLARWGFYPTADHRAGPRRGLWRKVMGL